ncbi:anti-sigma-factor antagonist [Ruegeria lacuscaerulensis ITI-1157]|nr:anti-sigma-factor antagonist [Ruegeria lacuscaerulensis ITI-1157]
MRLLLIFSPWIQNGKICRLAYFYDQQSIPEGGLLALSISTHGETQVIKVEADRIDAAMAIQFKEDMRTVTQQGAPRLILDLSSVEFIDSSGLGAIVASMKQLGDGRRLDLAGLQPVVEKVFRLTRMDTVFRLFDDLDDALAWKAE